MKPYKTLAKEFLAEFTGALRKRRSLTQDKMAEQLQITGRTYGDLERGRYSFATVTLLFLLLMLDDDELKNFVDGFRKRFACRIMRTPLKVAVNRSAGY